MACGDLGDDLPLLLAGLRRHHRPHPVDAPLGVGEGAVLLEERRARQEHVGELGRLVEEQVLDDEQSSAASAACTCVVLGSDWAMSSPCTNRPLERAVDARRRTCWGCAGRARRAAGVPHSCSKTLAHGVVGDVAVAGQLVGERAHVARALHVVLAAQRVDADAVAPDVAGGHGEVGHAHHHRRALAVLGDAEAVVDGRVAAGGVEAGGGAQLGGGHAGDLPRSPPGCSPGRAMNSAHSAIGRSQRSATNSRVDEALGDDDVGHAR